MTGLKTGSTSLAKYCLSATAEKDGVRLIASIMAAPDYKARFADAQTLLNYGYANCRLYEDKEMLPLPELAVDNGVTDSVPLKYGGTFSYLSLNGEDLAAIEKELVLPESIAAPVEEGQSAGVIQYSLAGKKLGEVQVLTAGAVKEAGSWITLRECWRDLQFDGVRPEMKIGRKSRRRFSSRFFKEDLHTAGTVEQIPGNNCHQLN